MTDLPTEPEVVVHWARPWRQWSMGAFMLAGAIGLAFVLLLASVSIGWGVVVAVTLVAFLALGGGMVRQAIRMRRERMGQGESPIQLDRQGFCFLGDAWTQGPRGRLRIPWSEVDGYHATHVEGGVGESLEVRLRDPTATYRVPPGKPSRFSGSHGVLTIHETWFDTSASQLVDLFQTFLGWGPGLRDQPSHKQSAAPH